MVERTLLFYYFILEPKQGHQDVPVISTKHSAYIQQSAYLQANIVVSAGAFDRATLDTLESPSPLRRQVSKVRPYTARPSLLDRWLDRRTDVLIALAVQMTPAGHASSQKKSC